MPHEWQRCTCCPHVAQICADVCVGRPLRRACVTRRRPYLLHTRSCCVRSRHASLHRSCRSRTDTHTSSAVSSPLESHTSPSSALLLSPVPFCVLHSSLSTHNSSCRLQRLPVPQRCRLRRLTLLSRPRPHSLSSTSWTSPTLQLQLPRPRTSCASPSARIRRTGGRAKLLTLLPAMRAVRLAGFAPTLRPCAQATCAPSRPRARETCSAVPRPL